ncbi:hypothetical protein [Polyangium jinanense]|uniref:Uncharacterized protein n=1 Tax=Polyangium jinanense TaxID=2829994 RepID=A0A9X4AS03_9BACT|nr:hypothetical protein [Polyangium jinanense]MDC3952982.1 hypothetical protein [Polyangium jinanense]MDC3980600.1 hypothetical protein [Polyangium jinanense]
MFSMDGIPFAPGTSPFRCKGVLYVDTLDFLDENVRGGRAVVLDRVTNAALREFLGRPFVVGGWYDLFPLLAMHGSASVVMAQPFLEMIRMVSRARIPRQFTKLYRFLLKMASPEMTMRNLSRIVGAYYDFVRVDVAEVRPKTFVLSASGVPSIAAPAYMVATEFGVVHALELAGARRVRHRWLSQVPEGRAHGMDVVRVRREVSWE